MGDHLRFGRAAFAQQSRPRKGISVSDPLEDLLTVKSVRTALRRLGNRDDLAAVDLARLAVVEDRLRQEGWSDSVNDRGRALENLLKTAILQLRAGPGEPDVMDKRWHPFIILHDEYVKGEEWSTVLYRLRPDLADAEGTGRRLADGAEPPHRTYQSYRLNALKLLAQLLHDWEDEAQQRKLAAEQATTLPMSVPDDPLSQAGTIPVDAMPEYGEKQCSREILSWPLLWEVTRQISLRSMYSQSLSSQADPYVQRQDLLSAFRAFLISTSSCFLLTGKSGAGKSSFLRSLLDEYVDDHGRCFLALDAAQIKANADLKEQIGGEVRRQLRWPYEALADIWEAFDRLPGIENLQVILILDEVNENPDPAEILRQANDLVGYRPWLKVVLACRPEAWLTMWHEVALRGRLFFAPEPVPGVEMRARPPLSAWDLQPFSDDEAYAAYAGYQARYHLKTDYAALPRETRDLVREPLALWFIASTYGSQEVPTAIRRDQLVDEYLEALLKTRRLHPGDRHLLVKQLIPRLERVPGIYATQIYEDDLKDDPDLCQCVFGYGLSGNGTRGSESFDRLVDAQIFVSHRLESPPYVELRHGLIYDHLLGQHLFAEHVQNTRDKLAICHSLIESIGKSLAVWGAITRAVYLAFRYFPEQVQELILADSFDTAQLVRSALLELAECEPNTARRVFRWVALRCKRWQPWRSLRPAWRAAMLAVEGAGVLDDEEVFLTLLAARASTLNEMAVDGTYFWGRKSPNKALDIADALSGQITRPRFALDRRALKAMLFLIPLLAVNCWEDEGLYSTELDRLLSICQRTVERIDQHPFSRLIGRLGRGAIASSVVWAGYSLLKQGAVVGDVNNVFIYRSFFQQPREVRERARNALAYIDRTQGALAEMVDLLRDLHASQEHLSEQIADLIVMSRGIHTLSDVAPVLWKLLDTVDDPGQGVDAHVCSCWYQCAVRQDPITEGSLRTLADFVARSIDLSKHGYGIVVREGRTYRYRPLGYYMNLWARVHPNKPVDLAEHYLASAVERHDMALLLHVIDSFSEVLDLTSHCGAMLRTLEPYVNNSGVVREHLANTLVALRSVQPALVDGFLLEVYAPRALQEEIYKKTRERPRRWHYGGLLSLVLDFIAYAPSPVVRHTLAVCRQAIEAPSSGQAASILANGFLNLLRER